MFALLTDEPRLVTAKAIRETQGLKIEREAFFDLLSDYDEIALGLLKNMVEKIKNLSAELQSQSQDVKEYTVK